ncbi:hypothetical protein [Aquimarina sp. 2201CG5-10]|uniref:hypothetical protein n=1 Tax=Aquimarina callyspongiae TaxID=3098150 RepID=UPI002AB55FCF|nr:hypothetical protein [Aquimarina sp. 2201CG5-10]MDY8138713.1 hypothetical protein [Aquimarina sp. 2201CG5-10]
MNYLKNLKQFEIPKEALKFINGSRGSDVCEAVNNCMQTAFDNGNTFLIPECERVLDPSHSCRNR